jgi:alpha/beta superfamily hydrolase
MDAFVFLLLGFVFGAVIGFRVSERLHQHVMPDLLKRLGVTPDKLTTAMQDLQKELGQDVPADQQTSTEVAIKIEQHGGQIYVFRKEDDQFLGQGQDYDAVIKTLRSRFQNVKFTVTPEDGADLLQKNNG